MFNSKLAKTIGKIYTFINELKAGIDINASKVDNLYFTIRDTKDEAHEKIAQIKLKRDADVEKQEAEQDALYNDIKVAEALVDNLTKLKG